MTEVATNPQADALSALLMPPALARVKLGGTAKPWSAIDGSTYRPGYHLTPQRLWSIYRQAEGGSPAAQCDTFEDVLENDGHMRGQYESRMSSVAFRPWIIQPGDAQAGSVAAAADLGRRLRGTNMLACLWHLMEALGYGYSGVNIAWDFFPDEGSLIGPKHFLCAPHRRFIVNEQENGALKFLTEKDAATGRDILPGEWLMARRPHRKILRAGLFRTTTWWALFKRMSITDWIVFAEKFGIPLVTGYYNERASPESKAALSQAVVDIGTDGQAVLSDLTKIVVDNTAVRFGDVGALHPAIAATCNAEISKVLTGATLNVESGGPGSFALGKVHEGRATSLSFADALWVQSAFNEQVCVPFIAYNPKYKGAAAPRLSIRVQPEMSPEVEVKVYQALQGMGLKIEDEQMYERFGLRRPEVGGELKPLYALTPPKPPAPAPA